MFRKIPTQPTATVALKRATAAFVEADVYETREDACGTNNINILSIIWDVVLRWHGLSGI